MGLDVYVMPLTKFLAGDYVSPLEEAFGDKVTRIGSDKSSTPLEKAAAKVDGLQDMIVERFPAAGRWNDEGETTGDQFDYDAFDQLRYFATYQDYPQKSFFLQKPLPFDPQKHTRKLKAVGAVWHGAPARFKHLIVHADHCGFYLPMEFPDPIFLTNEKVLVAGSSPRLLAELTQLRAILGLDRKWSELSTGETIAPDSDPLATIKYACAFLHHYAEISVDRRLPIVFDG